MNSSVLNQIDDYPFILRSETKFWVLQEQIDRHTSLAFFVFLSLLIFSSSFQSLQHPGRLGDAGGRNLTLLLPPVTAVQIRTQDSVLSTLWRNHLALSIMAMKSSFPPSVLQLMEEQNHRVIKLIWISNPSLRKSKLLFLAEPQGSLLNFSVHFPLLAGVSIRAPP